MGVTIHYSGVLAGAAEAELLLKEASAIAAEMEWGIENLNSPNAGLVVFPHPDCEPLAFNPDDFGMIESWVKTQFAGPETHIQIVDFFSRIAPHFENFAVEDEGEYWETKDRPKLEAHFEQVASAIREMQLENPSARVQVRMPDGRIVDMIT
jgi:hypothetical protein